ncbi:hypothetical protein DPMN_125399 [Dreissena polymorpha]|uniref:Uncharacterized protein n=1 Tax=Dreissena polymorpha TaxID=45954 RepID=A0A9D4GTW7_DREPO|nr:hypothetical protein DPMN_125399 [Dreissena polymorpha]
MTASKRKSEEKGKATPAKKTKTEAKTPAKKTPAKSAQKKATPKSAKPTAKVTSKVKKPETKKTPAKNKTPAKAVKTPAKAASKTPAKSVLKTPAKAKTPVKKTASKLVKKSLAKPVMKKSVPATKKMTAKPKTLSNVTKASLEKAKAIAAKAKLKTAKSLPKSKIIKKTVTPAKEKALPIKQDKPKEEEIKEEEKEEVPKETQKQETANEQKEEAPVNKRKAEIQEDEPPRKRRMITPNKKFEDYELEVPILSKRVKTPNPKYADYETETPSGKKVSELRAFIKDKKAKPAEDEEPAPEKKSTKKKTAEKGDNSEGDSEANDEKPKVFKESDMKPAEKLMKKLQKKLEKEAQAISAATPPENREKAKIKITKVVDYNKPVGVDDVQIKKLAKKVAATPKSKAAPKQKNEANTATAEAAKTPKAATKPAVKATPKAVVEKIVKPKKIKEMKKEERPIQAQFFCQKTIKLNSDNKEQKCWITGIGVFPSGEIVMVDMANKKIKLFGKEFEYLSQAQLDTIPQDISVSPVDASCAYFTKPFSKEGIQKVVMADGKLALKEYFVTNGTNRGITCIKAGILTSVQDGRYHDVDINHFKIYLLDYTGNVLQAVSTDTNGSRLFKLPLYFTVSSNCKQLIVSDCIKQNSYIVNVDMSGKIKFKYSGTNNNLITPRGLTIDDEDNIYVTEWERSSVYILNAEGKRTQTLMSHRELQQEKLDGLIKPYQLCYYKTGDTKKLIVSQEACDTVKVFKLLKREEVEAEAKAKAEEAAKKPVENGDPEKKVEEVAEVVKGAPEEAQAVSSTEVPVISSPPVVAKVTEPAVVKMTPAVVVRSPTSTEAQKAVQQIVVHPKPVSEKASQSQIVNVKQAIQPTVTVKSQAIQPKVIKIQKPKAVDPKPMQIVVQPNKPISAPLIKPQVTAAVQTKYVIIPKQSVTTQAGQTIVTQQGQTIVAQPYRKLASVLRKPNEVKPAAQAQLVITTTAASTPVIQALHGSKKEEVFSQTADDFNEEADAGESEMNGKLQDLVHAFQQSESNHVESIGNVIEESHVEHEPQEEMTVVVEDHSGIPEQHMEHEVETEHQVEHMQVTYIQVQDEGQVEHQDHQDVIQDEVPMETHHMEEQTVEEMHVPVSSEGEMITTTVHGDSGVYTMVLDTGNTMMFDQVSDFFF